MTRDATASGPVPACLEAAMLNWPPRVTGRGMCGPVSRWRGPTLAALQTRPASNGGRTRQGPGTVRSQRRWFDCSRQVAVRCRRRHLVACHDRTSGPNWKRPEGGRELVMLASSRPGGVSASNPATSREELWISLSVGCQLNWRHPHTRQPTQAAKRASDGSPPADSGQADRVSRGVEGLCVDPP